MSWRARAALLLTVLTGYGLRVWRLDFQELRGDEAFGYFFSRSSYARIVADTLALREPHPVASYFVQKTWLGLAGDSEFALRYAGVFFSVAAIALIYRLARGAGLPDRVAVLSAALLAISPYAIWHSQDARMYSMSLALTLASSVLALAWLQRRGAARGAVYVAVSLLALHAHYFAVFIVLAQNLYMLVLVIVRRIRPGMWTRWIGLQVALVALYAPWLFAARQLLLGYGGNGDSPALGEALLRALSVFAVGESTPAEQRAYWALLAFASAGMGAVAVAFYEPDREREGHAAGPPRMPLFFALYLGVPILATWFGAVSRPIFDERYLAAAAPPFFVLVAAALLWVKPPGEMVDRRRAVALRLTAVALLVVLLGGSVASLARYYGDPAYSKTRGWRMLAGTLDRLSACVPADEARLIQNYPDPTLWYYYSGPIAHLVLPPVAQGGDEARAIVASLVDDGVSWAAFVDQPATNWDAHDVAQAALAERFTQAAATQVEHWPVEVYVRAPQTFAPLSVEFGNGLALTGFAVTPARAAAGGTLAVHLQWDVANLVEAGALKLFLHLLDGDGRPAAQRDQALDLAGVEQADSPVVTSYGILLPETLAPGVYSLVAGLYHPDASGAPRVDTLDGADFVALQSVEVGPAGSAACTDYTPTDERRPSE